MHSMVAVHQHTRYICIRVHLSVQLYMHTYFADDKRNGPILPLKQSLHVCSNHDMLMFLVEFYVKLSELQLAKAIEKQKRTKQYSFLNMYLQKSTTNLSASQQTFGTSLRIRITILPQKTNANISLISALEPKKCSNQKR